MLRVASRASSSLLLPAPAVSTLPRLVAVAVAVAVAVPHRRALTSSATHWARKSKPEAEIKIETEGEGEGEGPLFASKTKKGLSAAHDGDTEKNDVLAVLARLDELRQRTSAENGREAKVSIVREYEDLRELLSYIHQPKLRLGITSTKLKSYLEDKFERETRAHEIDESPETLLQLLHALPTLSGNALREAVACFLYNHGVWECTESEDDAQYAAAELGGETPFQTFTRLIDRSLNGGWGLNTLKLAWPEGVSEAAPKLVKVKAAAVEKKGALENKAATENKAVTGNKASASVAKKDKGEKVTKAKTKTKAASAAESEAAAPPPAATHHPIKVSLKEFKVALGKTITPPFHELFKSKTPQTWYASRKLDGVRCITLIDVLVPKSAKQPLSIEGMSFLSRSGNEFTSLDNLHGPLEAIATLQELRKWLDTDPVVVDTIPNGEIKRLVLDGEVCVLRKDGTDFVEDFHSVVSQVRRKNDQVLNPAYFLLDVLPWNEFEGPLSAQPSTFYDRHSHALAVAKHCDTRAVKCLEQWRVTTPANVEEMAQRAMENEWEGLVFRLDAVYKGKRSSDLYKFKKWQDAEYTVESLDTSMQRLSVDSVYGEYEACSNVWIKHKGHPVSVGTGFSNEQRRRYAADPSLIVGKQITVEYFAESPSLEREGVMSLRFPRVKQVWEEGERGV